MWRRAVRNLATAGMLVAVLCTHAPRVSLEDSGPRHVQGIAGRFVSEPPGGSLEGVKASCRVLIDGGIQPPSERTVIVAGDGSFQLTDLPEGTLAVHLDVDPPEPYLRLQPIVVRHGVGAAGPLLSDGMGSAVLPPAMNMRIPLVRGGVLHGRVGPSVGRLPPSARVVAIWEPTSRFDRGLEAGGVIQPTGAFRLSRVPVHQALKVVVGGLRGSGLLGKQARGWAGTSSVQLSVERGCVLEGRTEPPAVGCFIHVSWRRPDCATCLRQLSTRGEVDDQGRFQIPGLAPGSYDLVVAESDRTIRAVAEAVPVSEGRGALLLRLPPQARLDGAVVGLPERESAMVEVWSESTGLLLGSAMSADGAFSFRLPAGLPCSILARCGDSVALMESVRPPVADLQLNLVPGLPLAAKLDDAMGPVYVMAGRGGVRFSVWTSPGEDVSLGVVAPGIYGVQLLSWGQAYLYFLTAAHGLVPESEPWSPSVQIESGRESVRLRGP